MSAAPSVTISPRALGLSAGLLAAGLAVEIVTLFFSHPMAFVGFIALSGGLVAAGIVVSLRMLLRPRSGSDPAMSKGEV